MEMHKYIDQMNLYLCTFVFHKSANRTYDADQTIIACYGIMA